MQQLLPGFSLSDDADFDSFFAPQSLRLVKSTLQQFVRDGSEDFVYLSGVDGSGKSHLLQAMCKLASEQGKAAIYLPLQQLAGYAPQEVFQGIEAFDVICLDDLDAIAGHTAWEVAVFDLFNQRLQAEKPLYFAAREPARQLPVALPDLQSRLASCLSFQLPNFSDEEKIELLQFRARRRGIELNDACALFIIQRSGRGNAALIQVLDRIDQDSLTAGRKVTVPFIKKVFGW